MTDELKSLIEDAARLLGLLPKEFDEEVEVLEVYNERGQLVEFNPCDPERGDLMKVAMAAGLEIYFDLCELIAKHLDETWGEETVVDYQEWEKDDYDSLALAILRAASSVWKARNENAD